MAKLSIYFIIFQLLVLLGNVLLFSSSGANLSNIYCLNIFMIFYMFAVIILNSYQFFAKRKYILLSFTALSLVCYYAEIFNYYITGMSFYEAFWDLMSFEFIKTSILIYWHFLILFSVLFVLKMYVLYKMLVIQQQYKIFYKTDKVYKFFILIILGVFIAMGSSFMSLAYSYADYRLLKDIRNPEYNRKTLEKEDIKVESTNGKNVVHIILESYANVFVDNGNYIELTPSFRALTKEGIYLKNLQQVKYAKYSEAGNIMANKGRMPYVGKNVEDYGFTYLLKQAGYNTAFYRGSKKAAGGFKFKQVYSKENGVDEFFYEEKFSDANEKYDKSVWGVSDDYLFAKGLEKYKEFQRKGKPFYLGLFTLDTHVSQEISKTCKDNLTQLDESVKDALFLDAIACTDYIVGNFIKEIKKLPDFENTLIIIHADHMPYFVNDLLMGENSKQFGLILNSRNGSFIQNNETYLFDIPATIIKELEIKTNFNPLLGENMTDKNFVRTKKTNREEINVFERLDYNDFSTHMILKSILKLESFFDYERTYH